MKAKLTHKLFPFLSWLPMVNRETLRADLIAGITGAIIVIPQGVAFAMIAGMPPIYGLYTAMIPPIVAALFGSSWHQIAGPTTALSIVVFSSISQYAVPESAEFVHLALSLTFLAGLIQLSLGLARMGTLVNFVSQSVIMAFTAGAAVLIATKQLKHVFGITLPGGLSFWKILEGIGVHIRETNLYVFSVAMITLFSALLIKRFLPRWPNMLLAMILGSLAAYWMGGEAVGIKTVGEMPASLPPFEVPDMSWGVMSKLASNAFAIALLGLIADVAIARSIAMQTRQQLDINQEFIGQGLANTIGSFFSCYPATGSFTRSGVNFQAGARTPMSAIFAALLLMLAVLFIAPWTAYLPIPAMGGILLLVAYNLIDIPSLKMAIRSSKSELAVLVITFISTLTLDLEFAIYVGIFFSLIFYLQRTSRPNIAVMAPDPDTKARSFINLIRKPDLKECPQLKIIRIDGSLFFGAVSHVQSFFNMLDLEPEKKHLLILADGINFIDLAGVELLWQETEKRRERGGDLYFAGLKNVAQKVLINTGIKEKIGEDHFFFSKREAIHSIFQQLDKKICENCDARIFEECGALVDS